MPDEGRTFLANGAVLLVLSAGPSLLFSRPPGPSRGVWKAGVVVSGPDLRSPAPCPTARAGPWSSDTADTLALPPWHVPRERSSARRRGGPSRRCAARPCWRVSVPCLAVGGAPGALQVVPQVPEAERWCCSLFPACSLGPHHGGVSPEWLSWGGRDGKGGVPLFPPSVGGRVLPRRGRPPTAVLWGGSCGAWGRLRLWPRALLWAVCLPVPQTPPPPRPFVDWAVCGAPPWARRGDDGWGMMHPR